MNTNTTNTTLYEVKLSTKNGVTKATVTPVILRGEFAHYRPSEDTVIFAAKAEAEAWAAQYDLDRNRALSDLVYSLKSDWDNNLHYPLVIDARTAKGIAPADQVVKVLEVLNAIVNTSTAELWAVRTHHRLTVWHKSMSAGQPVIQDGKRTAAEPVKALIDIYSPLADDTLCRSRIREVNSLRYWIMLELTLVGYRLSDGTEYNGGNGHD